MEGEAERWELLVRRGDRRQPLQLPPEVVAEEAGEPTAERGSSRVVDGIGGEAGEQPPGAREDIAARPTVLR